MRTQRNHVRTFNFQTKINKSTKKTKTMVGLAMQIRGETNFVFHQRGKSSDPGKPQPRSRSTVPRPQRQIKFGVCGRKYTVKEVTKPRSTVPRPERRVKHGVITRRQRLAQRQNKVRLSPSFPLRKWIRFIVFSPKPEQPHKKNPWKKTQVIYGQEAEVSGMSIFDPLVNSISATLEQCFKDKLIKAMNYAKVAMNVVKIALEIIALIMNNNARGLLATVIVMDIINLIIDILSIDKVPSGIMEFIKNQLDSFTSSSDDKEDIQKKEKISVEIMSPELMVESLINIGDSKGFTEFVNLINDSSDRRRYLKKWTEKFVIPPAEYSIQMLNKVATIDNQLARELSPLERDDVQHQINSIDVMNDQKLQKWQHEALKKIAAMKEPIYETVGQTLLEKIRAMPGLLTNIHDWQWHKVESILKPEMTEEELNLYFKKSCVQNCPDPDYKNPGDVVLYTAKEGEIKISGMCFFKSLAAYVPVFKTKKDGEKYEGTLNFNFLEYQDLEDLMYFVKFHTGFDMAPRIKNIEPGKYHFEGIEPTEAAEILRTQKIKSTIHYGTWVGNFKYKEGYFEESTQEKIDGKHFQKDQKRVELYFMEQPFAHWMPAMNRPNPAENSNTTEQRKPRRTPKEPKGEQTAENLFSDILSKIGVESLLQYWPKIVSWIITILAGTIISKTCDWLDIDKAVNSGMQKVANLEKYATTVKSLESKLLEMFVTGSSPTEIITDKFLKMHEGLNKYLSLPTSHYFKKPWQVAEMREECNYIQKEVLNLGKEFTDLKTLISGALIACEKYQQELQKELSQRATRIVPTAVYFFGDEGVGKTTLLKDHLAPLIAKRRGYPKHCTYSFKPAEHFDPYHQEPIAILDEAFSKSDLSKDCVADKFNALISSDNVNLSGAALTFKDAPCSWEYLLMASNVNPVELASRLPLHRSAIPAFFSRILFVECTYNQGPVEAAKPRAERLRLPNCGHITFKLYEQDNTDAKLVKEKRSGVSFEELDEEIERIYKINERAYNNSLRLQQAEGNATNHFVVNMNGPPNCGKSEFIQKTCGFFQNYGMRVYHSKCGEFPKYDSMEQPVVVVVDDQVSYETKERIDPKCEAWYMQLYNSAPNNSVFIVATNIVLKKDKIPTLLGHHMETITEAFKGKKPRTCKLRQVPFTNPGMSRRMGYCGYFKIDSQIEYLCHNREYQVSQSGFVDVLTKNKFVPDLALLQELRSAYVKFLNTYKQFIVHFNTPPPFCTFDINMQANAKIFEDMKSPVGLYKLINGVTANGNSIKMNSDMETKVRAIPTHSLTSIPAEEYTKENVVGLVKHYVNLLLPRSGSIKVKIVTKEFGTIVAIDRDIYITDNSADESIKCIQFDPEKITATFLVDKENFVVNIWDFIIAQEKGEIFSTFLQLPPQLIVFLKSYVINLATQNPALYQRISFKRKALLKTQIKRDVSVEAERVMNLIKEHPYWTGCIAFGISLFAAVALFKTFKAVKKAKRIQDIEEETLKLIADMRHSLHLTKLGIPSDVQPKMKLLKTMQMPEIKNYCEHIMELEAKHKGGNSTKTKRNVFQSRKGKSYHGSDGKIYYTDDRGVILADYDRVQDTTMNKHIGRNIVDLGDYGINYEEMDFGLEAKSLIEFIDARDPQQPETLPLDNFDNCESQKPHTKIMSKIAKNLVFLHVVNSTAEILSPSAFDLPCAFAMGLVGKYVIGPKHAITGRKSKDIYISDQRCVQQDVAQSGSIRLYKAKHIYSFPTEEITMWEVQSPQFPPFADMRSYVAAPPTRSVTSENVVLYTSHGNTHHGTATYETREMVITNPGDKHDPIRVKSGAYVTYGKTLSPLSGAGSCGLPYYLDTDKLSKIYCGFHISSNASTKGPNEQFTSCFQALFSDHLAVLNEFIKMPETQKVENKPKKWLHSETRNLLLDASRMIEKNKAIPELPDPQSDRVKIIGAQKNSAKKPFNSPYVPTPFSKLVENIIPNTQRPFEDDITKLNAEQLKSLEKTRSGVPSAVVTQEMKWSDPLPEGESQEFLDGVASDLAPYFSQFFHHYRLLNKEEILSGVTDPRDPLSGIRPIETDAYPGYVLERNFQVKKKSQLIDTHPDGRRTFSSHPANMYLVDYIREAEKALSRGEQPVWIYKNCLKMEKLPKEKYHTGRIFTMGTLEGLLLERKYLAAYCFAHHQNFASHNMLGIRTTDFDEIAKIFQDMGGNGFSGDYSRFDKHEHKSIFEMMANVYRKAMRANGIDEEIIEKFILIARNTYDSVHYTLNTIYQKFDGLNSGAYGTQNFNSDNNLGYVYCGFKTLALRNKINPQDIRELFFKLVKCFTYGDDLLVAVHPSIQHWFNLRSLAVYLLDRWGMKLDTADKDGKEYKIKGFKELPFISRTPTLIKLKNGSPVYYGGIKLATISGLVHWTSSNTPEQIADNLKIALVECAIKGNDYFNKIVKIIKLAFKHVPGLTSCLTLMDRDTILMELYNTSKGFGTQQLRLESLKIYENANSESENFIFEVAESLSTMGNCTSDGTDYISELNRMWQANILTIPIYCDNGEYCTLTFTAIKQGIKITAHGREGNKKERKAKAAKDGYEQYEHIVSNPNTIAEVDEEREGDAASQWTQSYTKPGPSIQQINYEFGLFIKNRILECGDTFHPPILESGRHGSHFMVMFSNRNIPVNNNPKNKGKAIMYITNILEEFTFAPLAVISVSRACFVQPLWLARLKIRREIAKVQEQVAEMDMGTMPRENPAVNKTQDASAVTSYTNPNVQPLPTQTAATMSSTLTGAGEVMSSANVPCDIIELNPDSQPLDAPEFGGRGFSIEQSLYENYITTETVTFSSSSKLGDLLWRQSANPIGLSALHDRYASLHKAAIFATEGLYYIVSAMNVAAAIIVGWVPDISKKTFTIAEVMATSWKIIDLNGNKNIKLVVRDARRTGFYRKIADTDSVPGAVALVYSPLNNMYATSNTFAISIHKSVRFSPLTRFFDPITLADLTEFNTSNPDRISFAPGGNPISIPLSAITQKKFQLFIGGSASATYNIRNSRTLPFWQISQPFVQAANDPSIKGWQEIGDGHIQINLAGPSQFYDATINPPDVVQPFTMTAIPKSKFTIKPGYEIDPTKVNISFYFLQTSDLKNRQHWTIIMDLELKNKSDKLPTPNDLLKTPSGFMSSPDYWLTSLDDDESSIPIDAWYGQVQLGIPTIKNAVPLNSTIKRAEFVIPGQSGLNATVQNYYPIPSEASDTIRQYLDSIQTDGEVYQFDLINVSGIIATVAYLPGSGFYINSPVSNLISIEIDPKTLYISNLVKISLSSVVQRDYSQWQPFAKTASLEDVLRNQRPEAAALIAGAIGQVGAGIFGGISQGAAAYLDYAKWKQELAQQNTQFNTQQKNAVDMNALNNRTAVRNNQYHWNTALEQTRETNMTNSYINNQNNANRLANTQLNADLSLRNSGLLSAGSVNSSGGRQVVNVYNNVPSPFKNARNQKPNPQVSRDTQTDITPTRPTLGSSQNTWSDSLPAETNQQLDAHNKTDIAQMGNSYAEKLNRGPYANLTNRQLSNVNPMNQETHSNVNADEDNSSDA
uniref:Polyprotein n=1 Tax=Shrew solinvivirus TaxID=3139589 RepID=A0AB38ZKA9_9VIRU